MNHTKGPWGWRSIGGQVVLWGDYGHRPIILDTKRKGMQGATLRVRRDDINGNGVMFEFEENADTALIAAAPDLYAALIDLAEDHAVLLAKTTPSDPREDYSNQSPSLLAASEALKKARGNA